MKMSKIENNKALNIIRQKYPKADFWVDEETKTYNIAFEGPNSRVYSYKCSNTLHFLQRLNLIGNNVMYNKDYKYYKDLEQKLLNKLDNINKDKEVYYLMTKEQAIYKVKQELNKVKAILNECVILDI